MTKNDGCVPFMSNTSVSSGGEGNLCGSYSPFFPWYLLIPSREIPYDKYCHKSSVINPSTGFLRGDGRTVCRTLYCTPSTMVLEYVICRTVTVCLLCFKYYLYWCSSRVDARMEFNSRESHVACCDPIECVLWVTSTPSTPTTFVILTLNQVVSNCNHTTIQSFNHYR